MSGYRRDTSPFLDSLAGQGVRFVNAFAQASWTLPSHVLGFQVWRVDPAFGRLRGRS